MKLDPRFLVLITLVGGNALADDSSIRAAIQKKAAEGKDVIVYKEVCKDESGKNCKLMPLTNDSPNGCIPINQKIVFAAEGVKVDGNGNIVAGSIPGGGANGVVVVLPSDTDVGSLPVSGNSDTNTTIQLSNPGKDGTLRGSVVLSNLIQRQITYTMAGQLGSTGYSSSAPCVSNVALQGYLYQTVPGFTGNVYLYLNNSAHGYTLPAY